MSSDITRPEEKIFRERLLAVRKEKGLTQKQLAEKIGVIYQAIGNFEKGHNLPTFQVLVRLAEALETSLDYLAALSDDPKIHKKRQPTTEK